MAEPNKQHTGDGSDNLAQAARKSVEAAKQISNASGQSAAVAKGAAAGAEAAANAAAATVHASIGSGNAVAQIATGTASGEPWGAILAAAWAMRHSLFKVLVSICLFLLFLIVMVVSLPTIMFNNIFRTDPGIVPPSAPTEIFEIYEQLSAIVSGCVSGGYDHARTEVERIIASSGYDHTLSTEATIDYGRVSADYDVCYILAAYSASMGQRGATVDDMKNKLDAVAHLMFPVTHIVKETTITIPPEEDAEDEEEGGEPTTVTVQYVECTIHPFDGAVILAAFGVDPDAPYGEFNVRLGDAIESMATALKRTLYGVTASGQVPPITDSEQADYLASLSCSPARKELMRVALSLVGRVPYFWGGKSAAGWNDEWNTPKLVTAAGSSSTGTLRPYGLDCSGYTDWVYRTALGHSLGGGGTWSQWDNSYEITEAELLPGDLGFQNDRDALSNHVLMYAGADPDGNKLWVHCSGSAGGVAMNYPTYVRYFRRVSGIDLENIAIPDLNGG